MPKPVIPLGDTKKKLKSVINTTEVAAHLITALQLGDNIEMPRNRPMPSVGRRCGELRFKDGEKDNIEWRILYRLDTDAIIIAEIIKKKTGKTPKRTIDLAKRRLKQYDLDTKG